MALKRPLDARILLVRPRNPDNIGAAARAAANFGVKDFGVVNPYPPIWKETRAAAGGLFLLRRAKAYKSVREAVKGRRLVIGTTTGDRRVLSMPSCYLPDLGAKLDAHLGAKGGKIAILFGSEKGGLANDELEPCNWILTIPTAPDCPSMNLGQAVALVCYELMRDRERPRTPLAVEAAPMKAEHVEIAAKLVDAILDRTGYLTTWNRPARDALVRQTLLRWNLREPDRYIVNGGLRWFLKRLPSRPPQE